MPHWNQALQHVSINPLPSLDLAAILHLPGNNNNRVDKLHQHHLLPPALSVLHLFLQLFCRTCPSVSRLFDRIQASSTKALTAAEIIANSSFAIAKSKIGTEDIVTGGSDIQDIIFNGIGRKQMGQYDIM